MKSFRCPCRTCLVEPVCKNPCEPFNKFIVKVDKVVDKIVKIFGIIDDTIRPDSIVQVVFDWVGEHILLPGSLYLMKVVFGMKTSQHEFTLFDERYNIWIETMKETEK